jgi:hypothetical protein
MLGMSKKRRSPYLTKAELDRVKGILVYGDIEAVGNDEYKITPIGVLRLVQFIIDGLP